MALISVIHRASLGSRNRLDPEYYKPEYLQLGSLLATRACRKLSALLKEINCGPFGSTVLCDTYTPEGILVIRPFNIKDCRVDDEDIVYISKEDIKTKNLKTYSNGNIVFSRVGDIRCGIIDNFDSEVTISPNIIAVKLNRNLINPYYVCTFMNTRYGYMQLERTLKIVAQPTIETETVKELLIPQINEDFQSDIETNVKLAFSLQDTAKSLYAQAEDLLLEELGLKGFKPKYELSYIANLSKAFGARRVDAEYFQPAYDFIEGYLVDKFSAKPIGKIDCIEVTTGQYSEEYVEKSEGWPYIRGTDIRNGTISTDDLVYIPSEHQVESKKAKEGDVVVTRVGTIGLSARIPKECEVGTISDNLIRLRFDEQWLNSYYLALYFGSPIGVSLMIRNSRGSVQQRLNQETLKEVVVPTLAPKTQQEIGSLVEQSHTARREAKALLRKAKRAVEIAIEEGEDQAKEFLDTQNNTGAQHI